MIWRAKIQDVTSVQPSISLFNFPQKEITRDFSTTFEGLSEAVFYSSSLDPYPEQEQPHLGVANVSIDITNPVTIDPDKKVLVIVTTQPLFNGATFNAGNLIYRSRYVLVGADNPTGYDFNYMHPGTYYVNAIYDDNGDQNFSSGDFMNSSFDAPLTVNGEATANTSVTINFQIP